MKWNERIEAAKERKRSNKKPYFTDEDRSLAQLWITDPISEVKNKIELKDGDLSKGPVSIYLILDGIYFTVGVEKDDVELAANCYNDIMDRVISDENLHWLFVIFLDNNSLME